MRKPFSARRNATALAFAMLSLSEFAPANEVVDEIIVSADLRGRTASEIPGSVSVLSAEEISQRSIQHFEELIGSIPNLNWSGDGHRARYFQIRGVGELEQYEGAPNPSVGFLIDDIDFSGIGTIATLFDMQRVEVLRGPQGSRYGANALAGLIYLQSAEPTDTFSGQVRLSAGQDNALAGGAAFGGPLNRSGSVGYRLSAHHYQSDGFHRNAYLGRNDTNGRDETTVRGKLAWNTHNDWSLRLATIFSDIDDGYDAFAIDNSLTMLSDKPGKDAQSSLGSSLKAEWSGSERWRFTSITSGANSNIEFSFDADWGNDDVWAPITYDYTSRSDRKRKSLSQEFRLSSADGGRLFNNSTEWLVGLYALRLTDELVTHDQGEYLDPGTWSDSVDAQSASRFQSVNAAAFGQLDIDIGDNGWLGFGLRVERRSTDYHDSNSLAIGPDETMAGGNLSYSHTLGDSTVAFVNLSKGYKAGGFNLGYVPDEQQREFGQEGLWNLEAGLKSAWFDGALALNGSVFYSKRRDQQVRTSLQEVAGDPTTFVFFTDNAAEGSALGLEADLRWLPNEAWELYANIGLLRAEFDDFQTLQTGDTEMVNLAGRAQPHAPEYTLALGGIYRHDSGVFARLDVYAKDSFYFDVSHNHMSQAYQLANARLGYDAERWSAQLWARNLFDESYAVRGFFFGNEPPFFPNTLYIRQGDPRQLGVTIDWRFE